MHIIICNCQLLQLHAVGETPGMLFVDLMMTGVPECDRPSGRSHLLLCKLFSTILLWRETVISPLIALGYEQCEYVHA